MRVQIVGRHDCRLLFFLAKFQAVPCCGDLALVPCPLLVSNSALYNGSLSLSLRFSTDVQMKDASPYIAPSAQLRASVR
jgi:hypothetical protein